MSEYELNQRQYNLMLNRLIAFEQGRLPLDTLVVDLEGLLNVLERVEPSWKQTFLHDWGKLEDVRAVALSENLTSLDEEMSQVLRTAIGQLKLLVLEKIDDPADHPQDMDWTKDTG